MTRRLWTLCALLVAVSALRPALAATPSVDPVVASLQRVFTAQQPKFKMPTSQAVAMLDDMLIQQYRSGGRMSAEPDAALKPLYYQASALLMNGYPIAGGTLVNAARRLPAFRSSPAGRALGQFVDAMLTPTDEEDQELIDYQTRSRRALNGLAGLPETMEAAAQVWVLGEVYDDSLAVAAGRDAFNSAQPSEADRKLVDAARAAGKGSAP